VSLLRQSVLYVFKVVALWAATGTQIKGVKRLIAGSGVMAGTFSGSAFLPESIVGALFPVFTVGNPKVANRAERVAKIAGNFLTGETGAPATSR
jgi:hypothetical protein